MSPSPATAQARPLVEVTTPPGLDAQWDWILGVVLGDWLGLDARRRTEPGLAAVHLSLPGAAARPLTLGAEFWLRQAGQNAAHVHPAEPLALWQPQDPAETACLTEPGLPVLFGAGPEADLPLDVFGAAFWMLARVEELEPAATDAHDRFAATGSLAFRGGFLLRPLIDEYVELLRLHLRRAFPALPLAMPAFRQLVSHDVDSASVLGLGLAAPWLKAVARRLLGRPGTAGLGPALARLVRTPRRIEPGDPHNTFEALMRASERRGMASAFYFFGGRGDRKDATYRPGHPAITGLMAEIHARGHEIGLHPSYRTYLAPEALAAEAGNLRRACGALGIAQPEWGGRMHFLRWRWPDTARAWAAAGMAYDSTLGFADQAGFRCGTSREYTAFDPVALRPLALRLRPLVAMECSVIAPRYMGLGYSEAAREVFFRLKDRCRRYGGNFTLLWHNSHFAGPDDGRFYEDILDH